MQNHFTVLQGSAPGKNLVLLAAVHGNEPCGAYAFDELLPQLHITRGTVTFAIGNPEALEQKKRFVGANLNRMFLSDERLSEKDKASYEYRRSRELMSLLSSADALLDVHASNTVDAVPFVICEPQSYDIASALPVSIISSGWDLLEPGGTDNYVNEQGGKGICIECGYAGDLESVGRAKEAILAFLERTGAIDPFPRESKTAPKQRYSPVYEIHHTKQNFVPTRTFADFELVQKGELIGTDGGDSVRATKDARVVFVRERQRPGEEAFLLAENT